MLIYLHNQSAVLVTVFIEGVQLCYRVVKCLNRTEMRKNLEHGQLDEGSKRLRLRWVIGGETD